VSGTRSEEEIRKKLEFCEKELNKAMQHHIWSLENRYSFWVEVLRWVLEEW